MVKEDLKINQKVSIQLLTHPHTGSYASRVANIGKTLITLYAPLYRVGIVPVHVGNMVAVDYNGMRAKYTFTTSIVERRLDARVPLIVVKKPQIIHVVQRRKYYRIPVSLTVQFTLANTHNNDLENKVFNAVTVDLSGGGIQLNAPVSLVPNDVINLQITFPDQEPVYIRGRVVRTIPGKVKGYHCLAIDFCNIDEAIRDKLVAFIFDRQLDMRKKGLIDTNTKYNAPKG